MVTSHGHLSWSPPDTGLICHHLACNITGIRCSEDHYENQYCDEAYDDPATNANHDNHHCQV